MVPGASPCADFGKETRPDVLTARFSRLGVARLREPSYTAHFEPTPPESWSP